MLKREKLSSKGHNKLNIELMKDQPNMVDGGGDAPFHNLHKRSVFFFVFSLNAAKLDFNCRKLNVNFQTEITGYLKKCYHYGCLLRMIGNLFD